MENKDWREEFDAKFPNLGATDPKEGWYDAKPEVKDFIATSIQQAIVEERDRVRELKIVVWNDGSHKFIEHGITWEYENDKDWLCTILLKNMDTISSPQDKETPKYEAPFFKETMELLDKLTIIK